MRFLTSILVTFRSLDTSCETNISSRIISIENFIKINDPFKKFMWEKRIS